MGADGIIYNGIYDNGYNNNQVIFSFNRPQLDFIKKQGGNIPLYFKKFG